MKTIAWATAAVSGVLAAGTALASPITVKAYTGHILAARAKVTIDQARATALKARPGRVTDQELEKEAGGSGLRYSFDITSGGRTFEVGVDAMSGKVLENKTEGPHPD